MGYQSYVLFLLKLLLLIVLTEFRVKQARINLYHISTYKLILYCVPCHVSEIRIGKLTKYIFSVLLILTMSFSFSTFNNFLFLISGSDAMPPLPKPNSHFNWIGSQCYSLGFGMFTVFICVSLYSCFYVEVEVHLYYIPCTMAEMTHI